MVNNRKQKKMSVMFWLVLGLSAMLVDESWAWSSPFTSRTGSSRRTTLAPSEQLETTTTTTTTKPTTTTPTTSDDLSDSRPYFSNSKVMASRFRRREWKRTRYLEQEEKEEEVDEEEKEEKDLSRELQAQAGTVVSSFETTEFDPWITNCHVQTIAGFFLRNTEAAFLPRHNATQALRRIAQGVWSKFLLSSSSETDTASSSSSSSSLTSSLNGMFNDKDYWDVRERIETLDGDWFHADTKYAISDMANSSSSDNIDDNKNGLHAHARPARVVLIHGLESNSNSSLSQQIAQACHQQGMTVTCLNFRSCSINEQGEFLDNDLPGAYHLGFTDDLKYYLELNKNKNEDIFLVGFSLGANVVLKALGELGVQAVQDYGIRGAAVACAPLEQVKNAAALARPGINRFIYTNGLLKTLKQKAVDQWKRFCGNDDDNFSCSLDDFVAVVEYEKSNKDRLVEGLEDTSKVLIRSCSEVGTKLQVPSQQVIRGFVKLTHSITRSIASRKNLPPTATSSSSPTVVAADDPFSSASSQPSLSSSSGVSSSSVTRTGTTTTARPERDSSVISSGMGETDFSKAWKALKSCYSEVQTGVAPETIVASAVMGALLAINAGAENMDVTMLAGLATAYSAVHKGPIGTAARVVGDLALSACLVAKEFWDQSRIVRHERRDTTKLQLQQQLAVSGAVNGMDEEKNIDDTGMKEETMNSDAMKRTKNGEKKKQSLFDLPRALAATTVTEFDDAFIAPIYGFHDCWDYYRKTSSIDFLEDIVVPTLVINAEDDPFFDPSVFPIDKTVEGGGHAPVKLVRTKTGGHLGFCFQQVEDDEEEGDSSNTVAGKNTDVISWMPSELARFLQHIQGRRRMKRALFQHLIPLER